ENAVLETNAQRFAGWTAPAPAGVDKAEGCSTALEAAVFEGAELKGPGERQHSGRDHPPVEYEPAPAAGSAMDRRVCYVGDQTDPGPSCDVPDQQESEQESGVWPGGRYALENPEQWQRGRQHHGDDHEQPRTGVEHCRHDDSALRYGSADRLEPGGIEPT